MLKLHTGTAGVGCLLLEFCLKAFRAICRPTGSNRSNTTSVNGESNTRSQTGLGQG